MEIETDVRHQRIRTENNPNYINSKTTLGENGVSNSHSAFTPNCNCSMISRPNSIQSKGITIYYWQLSWIL